MTTCRWNLKVFDRNEFYIISQQTEAKPLTTTAFPIRIHIRRRHSIIQVPVHHLPVGNCPQVGQIYRQVVLRLSHGRLHAAVVVLVDAVPEDDEDDNGDQDGDEGRQGADDDPDDVHARPRVVRRLLWLVVCVCVEIIVQCTIVILALSPP